MSTLQDQITIIPRPTHQAGQMVDISQTVIRQLDINAKEANRHYLAIIYYCMYCKVPLDHIANVGMKVLSCPGCKREWQIV